MSYDLGFIKRAFLGILIHPFLTEENAIALTNAYSLFGVVLLALSLMFVYRKILARSCDLVATAAVLLCFVTSPYVIMMGHLCGYFDSFLVVLTILAIALAERRQLLFAATICAAGILVSETMLLTGVPIVLFTALLSEKTKTGAMSVSFYSLIVLPSAAVLLLMFASPDPQQVYDALMERFSAFGHIGPARRAAYEFALPLQIHLAVQARSISPGCSVRRPYWRLLPRS